MTDEEFLELEIKCDFGAKGVTSEALSARLKYAVEKIERMTEEEKDAEAECMRSWFEMDT